MIAHGVSRGFRAFGTVQPRRGARFQERHGSYEFSRVLRGAGFIPMRSPGRRGRANPWLPDSMALALALSFG